MQPSILIVDDEQRLAEVMTVALEGRGFDASFVHSVDAALSHLQENRVDLVLTDLRMPGLGGRSLLQALHRDRPALPVVVMTAYSSVRDAVDLVKEGAFDYISKPFEIDDLVATIGRALQLSDVVSENERLRGELGEKYSFDSLVGRSAGLKMVLQQVSEVCGSRATVLLQGESGTGKELVARAIHFNSPRRAKPFVAVNCAAIPEALIESELFGHVRGAFTGAVATREGRFAAADGGTLFLDEIGDMPPTVQPKVLRALQEQTFEPVGSSRPVNVDVRVVAASHKDLRQMMRDGAMREDLFYRLNVFPIAIPALRERIDDISVLAQHFLAQHAVSAGKKLDGFTPQASAAMAAYSWPGNIRELQNCIERAVIVARSRAIEIHDLPGYVHASGAGDRTAALPANLDAELERIERAFIVDALNESGGVQVRAAERLGISERSFWHRVKKLKITIGHTVD